MNTDGRRPVRHKRESVLGEARKAIEPVHGAVMERDEERYVYCKRCHRWQLVEIDAEVALQIHEATEHRLP